MTLQASSCVSCFPATPLKDRHVDGTFCAGDRAWTDKEGAFKDWKDGQCDWRVSRSWGEDEVRETSGYSVTGVARSDLSCKSGIEP